ncbi:hypothetical protein [Clostridium omnivorum]|uniref:Phr family secreted Rap phosphatase inhibitor n=1 Tax=Clostridium omnivorum TaxID=1604902 RepID=A0ABQ5NCG5_9CLOT|nr:hypothetical protein [Clostridium sp. E14]GLC32885.1 hypothetical protein bsdE14_42950 [Clostridium sp. E14]
MKKKIVAVVIALAVCLGVGSKLINNVKPNNHKTVAAEYVPNSTDDPAPW